MFSSGILMVIAGPSGAGKTTLAHNLVNGFPGIQFSVSTTTRSPRGDEVHGRDYFFVSHEEFRERIRGSFFLEWAEVHGNCYGTDGVWVREQLSRGNSVVLDIDVQGAVQIKKAVPSAVLVFVLPGSRSILLNRLNGRNTDSADTVSRRMKAAAGEVACMGSFDYFIQNDELGSAQEALNAVFQAESMKLTNTGWPQAAVEYSQNSFKGLSFWKGKKVVVSSGPTREMLDDVRFVSNRSSGLMGVSLAGAFFSAGAQVTLVSGPAQVMDPPGAVELVRVESASDMQKTLQERTVEADLLVMAAAVADYAPAERNPGKMKRSVDSLTLNLRPTDDILVSLQGSCPILAFALEYGNSAEERASSKLKKKGADAIFLNRGDIPGQGMESTDNAGNILFRDGSEKAVVPAGSKKFVAFSIAAALGRKFMNDKN